MQVSMIFGFPSLSVCSMSTMTRAAPWTRSIAPPMPFTILPGTIQLARSPARETCMPPRTAVSMWPPRIMPKESAESKNAAPGLRQEPTRGQRRRRPRARRLVLSLATMP
jgi:hypothetical protein